MSALEPMNMLGELNRHPLDTLDSTVQGLRASDGSIISSRDMREWYHRNVERRFATGGVVSGSSDVIRVNPNGTPFNFDITPTDYNVEFLGQFISRPTEKSVAEEVNKLISQHTCTITMDNNSPPKEEEPVRELTDSEKDLLIWQDMIIMGL
jgi:hypothetical protein